MSELFGMLLVGAAASFSVCTFSCLGYLAPVLLTEGAGFRTGVTESLFFMSGKILLYSTLGALAAWSGNKIPPEALYYATPLSGGFLILLGLWLRFRKGQGGNACALNSSRRIFGRLGAPLRGRSNILFLSGLITSLVPCPAVLALLTLAAEARSVPLGFAYGLTYGAGLLLSPVLIAGGGLSVIARHIRLEAAGMASFIRTVAGAVIILSGIRILSLSFP